MTFRRTVTRVMEPRSDGATRITARVDDPLHGFEVVVDVDAGGTVTAAAATAHRHPWTTCPGALASVRATVGATRAEAASRVRDRPVDTTCVHVTDLVWFALAHPVTTRLDCTVTRTRLVLARDGDEVLAWGLSAYRIVGGPFDGLPYTDPRWSVALDAAGAGSLAREEVRLARRALMVAIGCEEMDWSAIETGLDVPHDLMRNTCHTFVDHRVADAVCLVDLRRSEPVDRPWGRARGDHRAESDSRF